MVEHPPAKAVEKAANLVDRKDAAILAAAMESEADYLITLDRKHFLKRKARNNIPLAVCTPAEFLKTFEHLWLQE